MVTTPVKETDTDTKENDLTQEPPKNEVPDVSNVDMSFGDEDADIECQALTRFSAVVQYNQMTANAKANRRLGNGSKVRPFIINASGKSEQVIESGIPR